jgi:hypothetical protein
LNCRCGSAGDEPRWMHVWLGYLAAAVNQSIKTAKARSQ